MLLKIRVPIDGDKPARRGSSGYPLHPTSFLAAAGLQLSGLAALGLFSPHRPPARPLYEELVAPQAHKIIFYDFRKKPLDVTPVKEVGKSKQPTGAEVSKQAVIATSPKAKSKEQFIWRPAPKIEIPLDQPNANLIARLNVPIPAPVPPPPKEKPQPPKADPAPTPEAPKQPVEVRKPKAFAPPPPSVREPRLPLPTPTLDTRVPSIGAPTMQSSMPVATGIQAPSISLAPPPAPPAPAPVIGNANADVVVANLHPTEDANKLVPNGERPAEFSKAPVKGPAATGAPDGSPAVTVPNLSIREPKAAKPVESALPPKTILYAERVRGVPSATLATPLRPGARTIPKAVDARFQTRNVYTMLVPIENLPAYAGDWVLWFAERDPQPGTTPIMRAPVPFRKTERVDDTPAANRIARRVQIVSMLSKEGKLSGISLLTGGDLVSVDAVTQDVASWEFKPATRNGTPIDVDIVIEITFNLPPALAQRTQP